MPESEESGSLPLSNRSADTSPPISAWRVPWWRSLQLKLFIPLFIGVLIMVGIQVQLVVQSDRRDTSQRTAGRLFESAFQLETELSSLLMQSQHNRRDMGALMSKAVSTVNLDALGFRANLFDLSGALLAQGDSMQVSSPLPREDLTQGEPRLLTKGKAEFILLPQRNQVSCRKCHDANNNALAWIQVEAPMADRAGVENIIKMTGYMTVVILSLVFGLTIWALMFIHVRGPLTEMGEVMNQVMQGDFTARFRVKGGDELSQLGVRLNRMVEELELMEERVKSTNLELMMRAERMVGVGEMASRLAHEIRNPLAGIQSVVSIFREDFDEGSSERGILDETLNQISRIEKTVSDLLAFARPRPLQREEILLPKLLQELALFCQQSSPVSQTHEIRVEVPSVPPAIWGDRDRIGQMFLNIMLNGLQAMEKPGTLNVTVSGKQTPEGKPEAEVRIRDQGKGIPRDQIKEIFKAFYTTRSKGTGLGLAISRSIVQRHGGTLTIGGTGQDGTEFIVTLPADTSATTDKQELGAEGQSS